MAKPVKNTKRLGEINKKIIARGEKLPSVRLKDGTKVQTGTVATMLYNIKLYNEGQSGKVENELRLAIPTLFKVGMFDLFSPEEWARGENPGRRFVGVEAIKYLAMK